MLTTSAADTLTTATAIAAIVTMLIGIVRPFIEQLPFARPSAPTHDATLRLMNLALNVAGVLLAAGANGQLTSGAWLALVIQALAQASGSHLFFQSVQPSSSAPATTPAPATQATMTPAASLAALAAPSASVVAAAVNAAIRAQSGLGAGQ